MEFRIDLTGVGTKEELHERIAATLPLPEYYGKNLDALYDVLTECGSGWSINISGQEGFAEACPSYWLNLKRVFSRAAEETGGLQIRSASLRRRYR